MRTVSGETWEPTIGQVKEVHVRRWAGNVYRTKSGWWGVPIVGAKGKQLFDTRTDAVKYVEDSFLAALESAGLLT